MMAAILNSAMLDSDTAILDSDTLLSSLRFTQKHSHSTLTLTQTNSIWLKLIHSDSTWWWQPSWILPCWIQTLPSWNSDTLDSSLRFTQKHSHSTLTLTQTNSIWLKLIHSLTQLDDGSHLEFCHLEFGHLGFSHLLVLSSQTLTLPRLFPPFAQKNFTHSFWLNLMMAAILNSAILDSAILHKKNFTHSFWLNLMMAAILNGSHLEFCHLGFSTLVFLSNSLTLPRLVPTICTKKNFTHSFWLNLMMAAILNSAMLDSDTAILDSDTLLSSLRFTQKHSHSTLTLTQTNSIWLKLIHSHLTWWWQPSWILPSWILPSWIQPFCTKLWLKLIQSDSLIHSDSTWWWQPSWILPCWIQTLPSWIQTPCYLLSDSLKNTLTPLWLWLKLIQSDSNSFILT